MSLGYRVFFVHDGEVQRIAQKRFNTIYLKKAESLPRYAGQTVISVLVVYNLTDRKPDRIIRMDTQKIRFDETGCVDRAYEAEGLRLAASKMDDLFSSLGNTDGIEPCSQVEKGPNSVVDASKRFEERRWNQRHPELSGPVLKKILKGVFGSAF